MADGVDVWETASDCFNATHAKRVKNRYDFICESFLPREFA